jgi:hypothetical protein
MSRDEVHAVLGEPAFGRDSGYGESFLRSAYPPSRYTEVYFPEPDALGNQCIVNVDYGGDEVIAWEVKPLDRTTPPWLRRIAKALGW